MKETWVQVPVVRGVMEAFLVGSGPGVVMLQEIFGVNQAMREKARRLAGRGYTLLVPDVFWRLEPRVELGYTEEDRKKGFDLLGRFDFEAGIADIAAAARTLEAQTGSGVAVIGFCLGGRLAVAATAAYPFKAVASLYGVKLDADPARLRAIDVPLQVHVGDRDTHVPMQTVEAVRKTLADHSNAQVFVYPGAQHGFFNAARPAVYDAAAAQQAEERIVAMLEGALKQ